MSHARHHEIFCTSTLPNFDMTLFVGRVDITIYVTEGRLRWKSVDNFVALPYQDRAISIL